ncbi:MAG: LysR family transcriptional regulator [Syntrophorhabdales bacterium]
MRLPQINVQQLMTFYVVAKEESFSVAAERLFISQPAVTQQIKALDAQFGVKLVHVKRKRVHLTPVGEQLVGYAEEVINRVMAAENFLKSYSLGNLQIGVSCVLTPYLTPVIEQFKELYSSVTVSVREGPSLGLVEDLLDFKFDLCLVGTLPTVNKKLHVTRIPEVEKMVLVASPDYPLACTAEVKWEDLVHHPLIIQSEGSMARVAILRHFAKRNLTPFIGAEVDNIEFAKELARQKKGVALVFLPRVREEVAQGRLTIIPITDGEIRLGIDIVTNQERAVSPVLSAFLGLAEKYFAGLFPSGAPQET